jgi:DNA primase
MAGRVVVPIHDENGFLVAYAGRSVDETDPKYRFPPRFRKSLVLFNLHRAATHGESVVIVEGFFDCIKVHQAGLRCVVALMGCSLSIGQEELLQ